MDNKPNQPNTSDVIQVRYDKLNALRKAGRDPFVITTSDRDCLTETIKNNFEEYENKDVCVAGRIMSKRGKGKVSFLDLDAPVMNLLSCPMGFGIGEPLGGGSGWDEIQRAFGFESVSELLLYRNHPKILLLPLDRAPP